MKRIEQTYRLPVQQNFTQTTILLTSRKKNDIILPKCVYIGTGGEQVEDGC